MNKDDYIFIGFALGMIVAGIVIGIVIAIADPTGEAVSGVISYIGEVIDTGNCTNQYLDSLGSDSKDIALRFVLDRGLCSQ